MSTRDELRAILDPDDFKVLAEWCVRPDALPGEAEIVLELVKAGIGVDDIPTCVWATRRIVEQQGRPRLDVAELVASVKVMGGILSEDILMILPSSTDASSGVGDGDSRFRFLGEALRVLRARRQGPLPQPEGRPTHRQTTRPSPERVPVRRVLAQRHPPPRHQNRGGVPRHPQETNMSTKWSDIPHEDISDLSIPDRVVHTRGPLEGQSIDFPDGFNLGEAIDKHRAAGGRFLLNGVPVTFGEKIPSGMRVIHFRIDPDDLHDPVWEGDDE